MTRSIKDVRAGLATAASVDGMVFKTYPDDTTDPPCGYVRGGAYDPRFVFGGRSQSTSFTLVLVVEGVEPDASAERLEVFCDPLSDSSVIAAVQDETNWPDDTIDDVVVTNIGEITVGLIGQSEEAIRVLIREVDVEVYW